MGLVRHFHEGMDRAPFAGMLHDRTLMSYESAVTLTA